MSLAKRIILVVTFCLPLLAIATAAEARVGGGSSYKGSSSRSSGSSRSSSGGGYSGGGYSGGYVSTGGGGGSIGGAVFMLLLFGGIWLVIQVVSARAKNGQLSYDGSDNDDEGPRFAQPLPASSVGRGRQIDPTFSEVLFMERAVLLVTRLLQAAPRAQDLEAMSPYITQAASLVLAARSRDVKSVGGVTVGASTIAALKQVTANGTSLLHITVKLHLNRHLETTSGPRSFYSHESWSFVRPIGTAVMRDEDSITKFGCPGCGSPLDRDGFGRCVHCQTSLSPGTADWTVMAVTVLQQEQQGPLLTQNVQEVGTDAPTSKDPRVLDDADRLIGVDERNRLLVRARDIFSNLQAAWTARNLDGLRPFETDALFQSHAFWIREYERQGLRNRIDDLDVQGVELCRVEEDGLHVVAMCRIAAECLDSTVNDKTGRVVGGDAKKRRAFTEYWTFVKHKDAAGSPSMKNCPSCGAQLQISQSGVCEFCQSKLTLGRFDWVASRIEQDEEISGA